MQQSRSEPRHSGGSVVCSSYCVKKNKLNKQIKVKLSCWLSRLWFFHGDKYFTNVWTVNSNSKGRWEKNERTRLDMNSLIHTQVVEQAPSFKKGIHESIWSRTTTACGLEWEERGGRGCRMVCPFLKHNLRGMNTCGTDVLV